MMSPLRLSRNIALAVLLLALQWHSGLHSTSQHLPIGKRAELAAEPHTTAPTSNSAWFDVCDLCSAQLAASHPPNTFASAFQPYRPAAQCTTFWRAAAKLWLAQPRAPPVA